MITEELKKAVVKEALLLRKYATKKERAKLNFDSIRSDNVTLCIYGQMTGNCYKNRAIQLLLKCGVPTNDFPFPNPTVFFEVTRDFEQGERAFSAIECYIAEEGAKIKDLVGLIKS